MAPRSSTKRVSIGRRGFLAGVAAGAALVPAGAAQATANTVTIAYQNMVVPFRVLMEREAIEKETGYRIVWRRFDAGGDVIRAMASGGVAIGEAGSSPIAAATSQGLDIELFAILDDIGEAEQLVARNGAGVSHIAELRGKTVAVPFVSTAHYQLMFALEKAGLPVGSVKVLNMRPPEIAAAWMRGDIDAAFVWDPVLSRIRQSGVVLTSADAIAQQGRPTFDGLIVDRAWAAANRTFLTVLTRLLGAIDADYMARRGQWTAQSAEIRAIAKWTGADPATAPQELAAYRFPTLAEQASPQWLGGGAAGGAAKALRDTASFLQSQGRVAQLAPDYGRFVTDDIVKAALDASNR